MTLMAFPAGPGNGDTFGKWVYEGASGSWVLNEGAITLAQSTTDDLAEGTGNLYYTSGRVDSDIAGSLLDEDGMASDDATKAPTQQSVKAYVDNELASGGAITTAGIAAGTLVTEADGIGANDNDTTVATSAAIVDYVAGANAATADNADTADALSTARNINGVSFDGTGDVSNTFSNGVQLSGSTISMTGSYTGSFTASGDITAFSDKSLKSSIVPILDPMDKVKELTGYTFVKEGQLRRTTGLIAQEVQEVMPEAVHEHDDGLLSVAYGNLVGLLVETIKELNERVEELESKQ